MKNIRFATLALTLLAAFAAQTVFAVSKTAAGNNRGKNVQGITSSLNSWLKNPQPNSSAWRSKVQGKIDELRAINSSSASNFQSRYNSLTQGPMIKKTATNTGVVPQPIMADDTDMMPAEPAE